jgi:hypothetical protein
MANQINARIREDAQKANQQKAKAAAEKRRSSERLPAPGGSSPRSAPKPAGEDDEPFTSFFASSGFDDHHSIRTG